MENETEEERMGTDYRGEQEDEDGIYGENKQDDED